MHWPSANNDLFILAPSTILCPLFWVAAALSLPAKSIIWSLDLTIRNYSFCSWERPSMLKIRMAWDLELNLFAPVLATNLLWLPRRMRSMRSVASITGISVRFWTNTPLAGSSTIFRFCETGLLLWYWLKACSNLPSLPGVWSSYVMYSLRVTGEFAWLKSFKSARRSLTFSLYISR